MKRVTRGVLSDNAAAVEVCYAVGPQRLRGDVLPLCLTIIKDFLRFHGTSAEGESTTSETLSIL